MKKLVCVLLMVGILVGHAYAETDSMTYFAHSKVTNEVASIMVEWIVSMNDRIDNGEILSDMEKQLYLEYVGCYYSLNKIGSLEIALASDNLEMFEMFSSSSGLISGAITSMIDSYEDGTYTFEEVYDRLSPLLAIELAK